MSADKIASGKQYLQADIFHLQKSWPNQYLRMRMDFHFPFKFTSDFLSWNQVYMIDIQG